MLPESWVDSLFARLLVRYGADWSRRWDGIDMAAVKSDWAAELGGFATRPDAIRHALDNLPADRSPTVAQFRALCIAAPQYAPPQLPAPKADAALVASVKAPPPSQGNDLRAWANRLRERELRCERLTQFQRQAWRQAWREALAQPAQEVDA